MREYSKISPQFWVWVKQSGLDDTATLAALYLMTCPESHPFGIYYLVPATMAHYLGSPFEGVSKALRSLHEEGFSALDEGSGMVWIRNMAGWQILRDWEPLKAKDNRVAWANKEYGTLRKNAFLGPFYDKYHDLLRLENRRDGSPSEAPSKGGGCSITTPLPNQEQEQEQEQEHEERQVTTQRSIVDIPLSATDGDAVSRWASHGEIASVADMEKAMAEWSWSVGGMSPRDRAKCKRLTDAGAISRDEARYAHDKSASKASDSRVRYFLGVVKGRRDDAATELAKGPGPAPAKKHDPYAHWEVETPAERRAKKAAEREQVKRGEVVKIDGTPITLEEWDEKYSKQW